MILASLPFLRHAVNLEPIRVYLLQKRTFVLILGTMTIAQQAATPRHVTAPVLTRAAIRTLSALAPPLAARAAAALFRYPMKRPGKGALPGERFAVRAGRRTVRGGVRGDGPTVIVAHGWGGAEEQFDRIGDALVARGFRVVTFSAIAHGASSGMLSSMVEFRDSLRAVASRFPDPHAVIGHSLGAAASALAVSEGLPTKRLVLVAPSAHPTRFLNLFFDWLDVPQEIRERVLIHVEKTLRFAWRGIDVDAYGPSINVPTLVIHDRGDREVPWQEGADTARVIAGAELMSVDSLGHHRLLRDDRVVERIAEFVSG